MSRTCCGLPRLRGRSRQQVTDLLRGNWCNGFWPQDGSYNAVQFAVDLDNISRHLLVLSSVVKSSAVLIGPSLMPVSLRDLASRLNDDELVALTTAAEAGTSGRSITLSVSVDGRDDGRLSTGSAGRRTSCRRTPTDRSTLKAKSEGSSSSSSWLRSLVHCGWPTF